MFKNKFVIFSFKGRGFESRLIILWLNVLWQSLFITFLFFFSKRFHFQIQKNPHCPSTPETKYFYNYKLILTLVINKFPIKATRKKNIKIYEKLRKTLQYMKVIQTKMRSTNEHKIKIVYKEMNSIMIQKRML